MKENLFKEGRMTKEFDLLKNVELEKEETKLFSSLKKCYSKLDYGAKICDKLKGKNLEDWKQLWKKGGEIAHRLYTKLLSRGIKVIYSKYLYRNRVEDVGGGAEKLEFHQHIHAIEDTIKSIECKNFTGVE